MEIQHRWNVDERIWREKVRRFEHENRALKEDLARHLGHSADHEQVNLLTAKIAELEAENKELKDKIKGLNMQLGRLKNKG